MDNEKELSANVVVSLFLILLGNIAQIKMRCFFEWRMD